VEVGLAESFGAAGGLCAAKVLVLSDRGLYARWLYRKIVRLHWHRFMRINVQGHYCLKGKRGYLPLRGLIAEGSRSWQEEVFCFMGKATLRCTLLVRWEEGQKEPWLIVSDLSSRAASGAWHGMRAWIESFFKDCKRGGWQWHCSRMSDPKRAGRLWLVIAVTALWVVSVVSCFRRGLQVILARLLRGEGLVTGRFIPEP
jgi:hypothetical protein